MKDALYTLAVSFFGGLFAAIISHFFTWLRERSLRNRIIIDEMFKEIETIIPQIVENAAAVWSSSGGAQKDKEREIICQIHDLSTIISFLQEKGIKAELRLSSSFANFRRSVSGDDFDVKGRAANPSRSIQIRSDAIALRVSLRDIQFENNRII